MARDAVGRNGPGPVAMFLTPLGSIDRASLDRVIDELCRLDNASPSSFMVGGAQRPMINAAFGALVMYNEDREKASSAPAHLMLVGWGSLIRAEFDVNNQHLTAPVHT